PRRIHPMSRLLLCAGALASLVALTLFAQQSLAAPGEVRNPLPVMPAHPGPNRPRPHPPTPGPINPGATKLPAAETPCDPRVEAALAAAEARLVELETQRDVWGAACVRVKISIARAAQARASRPGATATDRGLFRAAAEDAEATARTATSAPRANI